MTLGVLSGPVRVWERQWTIFSRYWGSSLLAAVLQPLLYLGGMGLGVGSLVADGRADLLPGGVSYLAYLGPAVLVAAAMNVGAQDSVWPMLDGFKWSNAYRAMAATPLGPTEVAGGLALWLGTKALITSGGVALVLLAVPSTRGLGVLAAVPVGVLTGLAYALPITAWTATRDTDHSFPMILRFGIVPMFLFAGVFFPVDQLPGPLAVLARVVPLWHGVVLSRGAVLGGLGIGMALVHLVVLVAYGAVGFVLCRVTFTRRLAA